MLPLRLILDTNIVVSATLKPESIPRTVLLLAMTKPARWYVSREILAEYETVLARPELRISRRNYRQLLQLIRGRARLVQPKYRLEVTPDPCDNIFLECADFSRADYIVTGNVKYFPDFWKSTKVITPREFLSIVAPHLLS